MATCQPTNKPMGPIKFADFFTYINLQNLTFCHVSLTSPYQHCQTELQIRQVTRRQAKARSYRPSGRTDTTQLEFNIDVRNSGIPTFFWTKTKFFLKKKCNWITSSRSNLIQDSQLVRSVLPEFIPHKSVAIDNQRIRGKGKVLCVSYKQDRSYAYKRYNEVRSRNQIWRRKAVSIKYNDRVRARVCVCGLICPVTQKSVRHKLCGTYGYTLFSHIISQTVWFSLKTERNYWTQNVCFLILTKNYVSNISHSKRNWARYEKMYICSHVKCWLWLTDFNYNWRFSTNFSKNIHIRNFMKISEILTLILLMWRIWWAPNNATTWQMGFKLKILDKCFEKYSYTKFHENPSDFNPYPANVENMVSS